MINIKQFYNLDKDVFVENIMVDSRNKLDNSIFFCLIGLTVDSHKFIDNAICNGAKVIVHSKDIENKKEDVTYIKVEDTRDSLNKFADYFYGQPSHNMKMYGVTGTNGKTTTSYITYDLLNKLNTKAGYIGTLGYEYDGKMNEQYFTTPNINDLHSILKEINDAGCKACCLEVSSQGLDLHRTDSIDFDVACFTNLTHEHLDYHKNFDNYFDAKARLFENMKKDGVACINVDDEYGKKMIDRCNCKVVTYAIDCDADYRATNLVLNKDNSKFDLVYKNSTYKIETNLVAKFNVLNLLAAISSLVETEYKLEDIIPLLKDIKNVPGRCMHINEGQDFNVIVDFAHTPDGFIKILDYVRSITSNDNKIYVVFGMPGNRDKEKRPICGKIADDYGDEIILTTDDNHFEKAEDIVNEIAKGISKHTSNVILQRDLAIEHAIKACKAGDSVVILCKGNDNFFKDKDQIMPYEGDDKVASRIIKTLKY